MLKKILFGSLMLFTQVESSLATDYISPFHKDHPSNKKQQKEIVMLATPECGYCKQARNYFKTHSIAWREKDVSNQNIAVPVIFICGQRMDGWGEQMFKYYLQNCR